VGKELAERIIPIRDARLLMDTVLVAQVNRPPLSESDNPFNQDLWAQKHNGTMDLSAVIALDGILNTLNPGQALLFFNSDDNTLHEFLETFSNQTPED
jgi:hypothetical protein